MLNISKLGLLVYAKGIVQIAPVSPGNNRCVFDEESGVFKGDVLKCRNCPANGKECAGCATIIRDDLLHTCGAIWHRTYLVCQGCGCGLAHRRLKKVDQKPCCLECFAKLNGETNDM
jgi:hypothetical protein